MGNFSGVLFKALSSNALLTTTTFWIIQDRPDYKEGLVKDSNFIVQTRMLGFPLGWVFLSFDFIYRCWRSSPSVQKWKFWNFRQNASMNCWLCACKHRWQLLHTRSCFINGALLMHFVNCAVVFVVCFHASYSKKFAPNRLCPTNVNKCQYRKFSWKLVSVLVHLLYFALG